MFSGIYQSFIIHIFVMLNGVHTLSAEIKGKTTGLNGEKGTEIECSYTKTNVKSIISVSFFAFNKSSHTFNEIALYIPNSFPYLTDDGQYLKGRVTLMNITQSTTKAVMTFNKLMCIDDTLYQCKVIHFASTGVVNVISNNSSISVQVPPSMPDRVSIVPTPATKNRVFSSSILSTEVATPSEETLSTMQIEKQNETTAFNDSTLPKTDYYTTSSIPLNDDLTSNTIYRTTTYSTQQTTTERVLAEGDTITVICAGDVGKPPAKLIFQKYLYGKRVPMFEQFCNTSISELSENCSYYRTSNITFQVTAKDNNAVIRCVVNSSMAEPDMYVETEPIVVYYPVRMPTIINHPNKTYYVLGKDRSINLACKSDGNPKPSYFWYKENPKEQVSSKENFTITNMTNSGTYTCEVNNTFNGETYLKVANHKIKIINAGEDGESTPSISGTGDNKAKDNGTLIAIAIVIVLIVIGALVALIFQLYRRSRNKEDYKPVDRMESNMDQIESQETTRTAPPTSSTKKTTGYEDVELDDTDMKFKPKSDEETIAKVKQHNEEYLKKQKEDDERETDDPTTPPQAAVYACVNKPKNMVADQQEEDVYEDSKEGLYDTSGDRRHKDNISAEHFDSTENLKNEESEQNDVITGEKSHIGGYIKKAYENSENKEEKRQVATVSPTVRLWSSSQGEGQKSKSDEIQPKTEKQTTHETSL